MALQQLGVPGPPFDWPSAWATIWNAAAVAFMDLRDIVARLPGPQLVDPLPKRRGTFSPVGDQPGTAVTCGASGVAHRKSTKCHSPGCVRDGSIRPLRSQTLVGLARPTNGGHRPRQRPAATGGSRPADQRPWLARGLNVNGTSWITRSKVADFAPSPRSMSVRSHAASASCPAQLGTTLLGMAR